MCKWGTTTKVRVKLSADLSCTGKERWKNCAIDSCIAPIVKALQENGIDMRGCCCGHNKGHGDIHLQDGRILLVLDKKEADKYLRNRKPDAEGNADI